MGKTKRYDPRDDDYGNRDYNYRKNDKFRQRREKKLRRIIDRNDDMNPKDDYSEE